MSWSRADHVKPDISFRRCGFGREVAMLNKAEVGAVMEHDGDKVRAVYEVFLPLPDGRRGWRPATSIEAARRRLGECVADWLILAGLRPLDGGD
jgi:hypothetical protein